MHAKKQQREFEAEKETTKRLKTKVLEMEGKNHTKPTDHIKLSEQLNQVHAEIDML